jgi:sugar phosphate isomerase/epimerase
MRTAGYTGWVSLEYEGRDDVLPSIQKSLELLRGVF